MNKKEILEIRKQFTPENCTISRICGCYVDGEKQIILEHKDAFGSLPEEEAFKYFDIFKHTLSGTPGKNLINMEFPLQSEAPGGTHDFLLKLRDSHLEDEVLVSEFFRKIIEHYSYDMNYYIILISAVYDIPGKATDSLTMFDASEKIFDFLLCSICPVNLSKAGLSYSMENNSIIDRVRDWVVAAPANGFLFPAFHERDTDLHSTLFYTKKADELHPAFIEEVLGCIPPMGASSQKETFQTLLTETLGEDCEYEVIRDLHENLNELLETEKDAPEPLMLQSSQLRQVFEESGVPDEKITHFQERFETSVTPDTPILTANVTDTRQFKIETPDVRIHVKPDRIDLIETRTIDGRAYLVIPVEQSVEINGIPVIFKPQHKEG